MTRPPDRFAPRDDRQLAELVTAHPLAWVVSAAGPLATPLPLRPILNADGTLAALHGHFARANAQVEVLRTDRRALLLFMGPNGYISPSWLTDRTQAPTWIYASLQILADIELQDTKAYADASLADLTSAMEVGRKGAWASEEMGERYARLRRGVVAFVAHPVEIKARIKAGQDEEDEQLLDIISGLEGLGKVELVQLVRTMNGHRL